MAQRRVADYSESIQTRDSDYLTESSDTACQRLNSGAPCGKQCGPKLHHPTWQAVRTNAPSLCMASGANQTASTLHGKQCGPTRHHFAW
eukprot:345086-Chlamydomonas_euryale.AAC.1